MTIEERNKKLKAYITCLKCEVGGKYCADDCEKQYIAGNMREIIENLEAINNLVSKLEFGMSELKIASEVILRGTYYVDGWNDCVEAFIKFFQDLMEEKE